MRLWIGGAYQGKLGYLKEQIPLEKIRFCSLDCPQLDFSGSAITGLHLWIRAALDAGLSPLEELRLHMDMLLSQTILCDELGGGIVPLSREDRRWREETGKAIQFLSESAFEVTVFLAGIPKRLCLCQSLFLIRHGLTEMNLKHQYCGTSDPPLCEKGREALFDKRYPPVQRYFSSPSQRAVETLRMLYGDINFECCPALMECGFGEFEGHTYEELKEREDYVKWILDETGTLAPPGGESRDEHSSRVVNGVEKLLRQDFESAALLCHGGTIVRLMEDWFPGQRDFYGWQPKHGKGFEVSFKNGKPVKFEEI